MPFCLFLGTPFHHWVGFVVLITKTKQLAMPQSFTCQDSVAEVLIF